MFYKTINAAFNAAKAPVAEASALVHAPCGITDRNINWSDILTVLIQDAGRFAERHASDLFIGWKTVEQFLLSADPKELDRTYVFAFGIYESGVDHNEFLMEKLKGTKQAPYGYISAPRAGYRRVLALGIRFEGDDGLVTLRMELKNITNEFIRLADEDSEGFIDLREECKSIC